MKDLKKEICHYEDLPLTLSVEELMPVLGIGRNSAYALVRSGKIRSFHVGRKLRIPKESVIQFIRSEK